MENQIKVSDLKIGMIIKYNKGKITSIENLKEKDG